METYVEMKNRHQAEFNNFPVAFAFTEEDIKEGLKKLGLAENDKDKIVSIGFGGFVKIEDKQAYNDMNNNHYKELKEAIKNDITGEKFIQGMFEEELGNHEYGYTGELRDTLLDCGLTIKYINSNTNIQRGLELALQKYHQTSNDREEEEEI